MCGIAGAVTVSKTISGSKPLACLDHRGPDGKGEINLSLMGKKIWLGHTRLAILDLSPAGHQPINSHDGRWWVTFNGEIYNHQTLRRNLPGPFCGHSDTETLVELLANHGISATLPLLNGMFSFAALDTIEAKLYLVRDPFGIKPLYYSFKSGSFAFASEVKALHETGCIDATPDIGALQSFLSLRYVPSPDTLWRGINRLKPGHYLSLDIASMQTDISHFVMPVTDQFSGSIDDAASIYQAKLKDAISRQLLSDVPVGVLLSGGIDSALVAAMAKELGRDLPCFTVGFGDKHPECEISDAEHTARTLGLSISSITVTPQKLLNALPSIVRSVEEPLGTTSIMPMWYLTKRARQDVTVVLTGQGTDEPWGGYKRYQVEMVRRLFPSSFFWRVMHSVGNLASSHLSDTLERGLRTLPEHDLAARAIEACALFSSKERAMLTGLSNDGGSLNVMKNWISWQLPANNPPTENMMRVDARMNLADDLLLYGDKISMAASLEARIPMLDIELIKFVESLPLKYKISLNRSKIVHKLMAERYLPASIVHRKKKGFQVPFGKWSRGPWRAYIEEVLLSPGSPHLAYLDISTLSTFWVEHVTGRRDRSRQIFALLMLALWWREATIIT